MSIESPPQKEWNTLVHIDSSSGDVRTSSESRTSLDRETICPLTSSGELINECKITFLISINKRILVSLHLIIEDLNDSPPIFFQNGQIIKEISLSFSEAAVPGETMVVLPTAIDPDVKSPATPISYHLIGENLPFTLVQSEDNLKLCVSTPLDFERVPVYAFFIQACENQRVDHLCSSIHVTVNVENVNDHRPIFLNSTYSAVIDEDTPVGSTVLVVEAIDADAPPFGNISYSLVVDKKYSESFPFAVHEKNGRIFLKFPILEPRKYSFVVEASDDSTASKRSTALISIFVADVNNHKPVIELKAFSNTSTTSYASIGGEFSVELQEEVVGPTVLAYLTVTDQDEGSNALCSCQLNKSPFSDAFELTKVNQLSSQVTVYRLVASKPLDAEDPIIVKHLIEPIEPDRCKGLAGFLALLVTCADSGNKPQESQVTVYVALRGTDEFPTKFVFPDSNEVYRLSVQEDAKVGTKLIELEVSDKDTGKCIHISSTSNNNQVLVEPESGALVLAAPLDYEQVNSIKFTVIASERNGNRFSRSSATATVILDIINVNDNQPRLISLKKVEDNTCQKMISAINDPVNHIMECFSLDALEEVEVGYVIQHLEAFDADTPNITGGFIFRLLETYAPIKSQKLERLEIPPLEVTKNGDLIVSGRLDREKFIWVDLLISISDGEESSVSLLRVNLLDINDNTPVWQFPSSTDYQISVSLFAKVNAVVSRVQALDADSGLLNGGLEYKILPQPKSFSESVPLQDHLTNSLYGAHLFAVNSLNGKLSVKQSLPNQTEVPYRLDLVVSDKGKPPLESTAHLLISLIDKPFNEMETQPLNQVMSSNNLQNDGTEMNQAPAGIFSADGPEYLSSPASMENWIHIIGISVGALTLLFFIAIISFVLCKRMQRGSRSFCQKPMNSLELRAQRRQSWSLGAASPLHEVLLEKRAQDNALAESQQTNLPIQNPAPVSMDGIPTSSIAFGGGTSSQQTEMSGVKNVPVIVSVAVLPASSTSPDIRLPSPTEYVVISDGVAVGPTKGDWKFLIES
ncbi:hypothetical protein Aperf_G00000025548 [Anoplocephala perfoliata]